ncbi:unnamed protein product [Orchesella dallaii]|uniref:Uncharacterized protein n=1 Tax=Orchesella dallaii TaxID=48710 RepID=A0ABP1Q7B2_9HEXA
MRFRLPFTNKQLAKIATVGAVFVAGNGVLMHYLVRKRFYQSPYLIKAGETLFSHQPLVNYLGEPIQFGYPDLSDTTRNYSTKSIAQFEVPIKGSKASGHMTFSAARDVNENSGSGSWKLTSLEVIVDDRPNEKVVLVRKE